MLQDRPVLTASLLGATAAAGIAGVAEFRKPSRDGMEDRLHRTGIAATRGFLGVSLLAGAGYAATRNAGMFKAGMFKPAGARVGQFFKGQYDRATTQLANDRYLLSSLVPTSEAHATHLASLGVEPMSQLRATAEAVTRNSRIMAASGAGLGLMVGASFGHPLAGAAIGTAAGLGARGGFGVASLWKKLGKVPGARAAGILALSTTLFAGIKAVSPAQFQSEAFATPDGQGGYDASPEPSVRARMDLMKASGGMVFGLNRLRHG